MVSSINAMCMDMANPSDARLGQLRHMFMYLGDNPPGKTFGGPTVTSICCAGDEVAPFTIGQKEGCYHYFSDASINVTGGIGMFAGCCIQQLALRMHLQSPCAHTSEIVAGGTNVHAIVPVNGMLQELGIRRGRPTTTNFDSASTVFVATSDAAPKKSVWLARRSKVITETVEHNEISPHAAHRRARHGRGLVHQERQTRGVGASHALHPEPSFRGIRPTVTMLAGCACRRLRTSLRPTGSA